MLQACQKGNKMRKEQLRKAETLLLAAMITLAGCGKTERNNQDIAADTTEAAEYNVTNSDETYALETKYNGNMPVDLYVDAFQRTDGYIPNKELLETISDEEADKYVNTAKNFLNTVYGQDYRSLVDNQDAFVDSVNKLGFRGTESGEEENELSYAEELLQWYIDNHIEANCDFHTDKTLIYYDCGLMFVRGYLTVDVKKGDKNDFESLFGFDEGETYICEVMLFPDKDVTPCGLEIVRKANI